jgi:hypothetical protein
VHSMWDASPAHPVLAAMTRWGPGECRGSPPLSQVKASHSSGAKNWIRSPGKISGELPISEAGEQTLLTSGFGRHLPGVDRSLFLRFVLEEANEKLTADHEALAALAR